jgi:hypothetical protein
MDHSNTLEKHRKLNSVLVRKNQDFLKKREVVLPKLNTSESAPASIGNFIKKKPSQDFSVLPYREKYSRRKPPELLAPLFGYRERLPTPSLSSPSDSDFYSSDYDDSQFSDITEFSEIDSGFLETLNKEVSKRVISGMVLTTKCGEKAQDISEKNLGKRVEKFLGRPVPVSVITPRPPRPPRLLTPLTSSRQQRGDTWCLKQQKVSKVLSNSLRAVYNGGECKCRYIRAPLTPIPSTDWVFENCGKVDRILSATNR